MKEREYLEALCWAVRGFLKAHQTDNLCERLESADGAAWLERELDAHVRRVLAAGRPEDIVKWARFRALEPAVWREAGEWPEVLFRAAYTMVLEDLKMLLTKALSGELPAAALGESGS